MTSDPPVIPSGPIDREPVDYRPHAEQETILRATLTAAGVELGAYDERIVQWLAGWGWGTVAVIASWIGRAADKETT
ncbi:hypothetical protein ABT186_02010 [Streptomyces sp. NPDC001634]|uniref:hypothetical protein n=1 Tax=Streptomyces sp. NPDC001634 TaxID=3154390 RepID=UPI00332A3C1F